MKLGPSYIHNVMMHSIPYRIHKITHRNNISLKNKVDNPVPNGLKGADHHFTKWQQACPDLCKTGAPTAGPREGEIIDKCSKDAFEVAFPIIKQEMRQGGIQRKLELVSAA